MKRSTASMVVALATGVGLTAADLPMNLLQICPAEASPARQRTLESVVKPDKVQPGRKRTIKPQIGLGMLNAGCAAHFKKSGAKPYGRYICTFHFLPKCGIREELRKNRGGRLEAPVYALEGGWAVEYYCLARQIPRPGAAEPSAPTSKAIRRPSTRTVRPNSKRPPSPVLGKGMTALDCASHFEKRDFPQRGYYACILRFSPACGPGMKIVRKSFHGDWLSFHQVSQDRYGLWYSCEPQRP